ncbi:unnamed protein product [Acanthoscelides obtectus]|uniref:Uncharacterized protein n=1 Tax=Acanthoscelides obtectus TaxID=200917 RepID=A0A9P0Q5H8_ACAOB|nr:unnamed protein product [Acanthoscelides obtectus]CAK1645591.1 hypothetical protein AOBTE_LOCUS14158 [Acanthoscelides obtectus]
MPGVTVTFFQDEAFDDGIMNDNAFPCGQLQVASENIFSRNT